MDEFSRFPFAYAVKDTSAETTIQCLRALFSIFGMPDFIHSDRGPAFISSYYQNFLHRHGVSTSYSSAYNPRGNGQVERYNGVLWKTFRLCLSSRKLPVELWESVLPDALHSMRSLLCTATNSTPHERLFSYPRKAACGEALPSWLLDSDSVLLRKVVRDSKYAPELETVKLLHTNPQYARIQHENDKETTVSLRRLAPLNRDQEGQTLAYPKAEDEDFKFSTDRSSTDQLLSSDVSPCSVKDDNSDDGGDGSLRRSSRIRAQPDRYDPSYY